MLQWISNLLPSQMVYSEQELIIKSWLKKRMFSWTAPRKNHLLTALLLLFKLFTAHLLIRWLMNEWKSNNATRLLLFHYSFTLLSVSFRRAKTNFIGTISHLCIRLFLATCWLNIEITSWYHGLVYALNVYYIFYRVSMEWWVNESFV